MSNKPLKENLIKELEEKVRLLEEALLKTQSEGQGKKSVLTGCSDCSFTVNDFSKK
jgi:hypothetical protein